MDVVGFSDGATSCSAPSGRQAGDLLILGIMLSYTTDPIAGWTAGALSGPEPAGRFQQCERIATGTSADDVSGVNVDGALRRMTMCAVRGRELAARSGAFPEGAVFTDGRAAQLEVPGVNPGGDLLAWAMKQGFEAWRAPPTGWTLRHAGPGGEVKVGWWTRDGAAGPTGVFDAGVPASGSNSSYAAWGQQNVFAAAGGLSALVGM